MNRQTTTHAPQQAGTATPIASGVLQRKCACGTHTVAGGKCEECKNEHGILQRKPSNNSERSEVPPIVHEVLLSSGQPLDANIRAFLEPRFGHDFSQVRVHTDARAVESAHAVNALAYTVGRNVVFGEGRYIPGSIEGQGLIAHELMHTIQQGMGVNTGSLLTLSDCHHPAELDAEGVASSLEKDLYVHPGLSGLQVNSTTLLRKCRQHSNETFYKQAPNYCHDTGFSGALHRGERCYREVPVRSGYFQCPSGDQVCFDKESLCHDSFDIVSPVESKEDDGSCNLHRYCSLGHGMADIIPEALGVNLKKGLDPVKCANRCARVPGAGKELCFQSCLSSE